MWVASSSEGLLTPTAVALGKFDGVHLGHQRVIQPVLHAGANLSVASSPQSKENQQLANQEYIYSTVVTFDPHPQEFFTGQPRTLLTPLDEKVQQLRSLGVEQLVLLPFDKELSALTPEEFVQKILVQQLRCQQISIGQDFCFGEKRSGTAKDLQLIAAKHNIPVTIVPLQTYIGNSPTESSCVSTNPTQDARISTSLIRQTLEQGDIENANLLLGRSYTLLGVVVQGQQLGRTIGFPTANLQLPKEKFLPRQGVYAVRVFILSETSDVAPSETLGVMNIGNRPTVNGTYSSAEVHLFDWSGDLYGKKLAVELVKFLRPEQKFASLEALKTQIQLDCVVAKEILSAKAQS
ncbi:ribF, riboflavin kinase / FMN adenylyltransferase [Nostoc flagelliforme CCNUN1]|uniref:Riboflavin biosynthesis protein n=1 Tax=Nostoc flagelliforme CCNUN1 TaxID=2038116 RepID=A0A2K8SLL1_9NOSO|nr:bifunctional riboflavin kinase/FAD synthetase [Nostoc flagelliforme]AUB36332.1 ribF, riboflavin kinase / FMN adenylyltransferase [Nostoc flagelliforme CCNUN1]